jgi:hypothetical protein
VQETISTKKLAAVLGVSISRINELGRKGKITRESDGGWDLVKVNADLRKNLNRSQTLRSLGQSAKSENMEVLADHGKDVANDMSYAEAQRRHEWVKVQRELLDLRKRKGELLEAEEVSKVWSGITTAIKTRMLMVATKTAPRISDGMSVLERSAIIDKSIREALTALSEYEPDVA